ncbi:MAG: DUF4292 domain-containing protein [Chitinophagaceae bacterium]
MKNIGYFLCVLFLFAACRPAKKVQKIETAISKKDTTQVIKVSPDKPVDSFSLVKNIIANLYKTPRINFQTFAAKVKIEYEGKDESDQATAYLRMQKDSVIWISLRGALGIEGFRVLINKDTVEVMNLLKKTVQYRSISYLQELTEVPLDFNNLQNIIIGNPVFLDSNVVSYKSTGSELLVLVVGKIFKNLLTLDNQDFKILHSKLDDVDPTRNRTADLTFDDYEKVGDFFFSKSRKISIAEKAKLDINLTFKQYSFNQPQTFPFNIPKNYKVK